jgi:hypothetical protein
MPKPINRIYNFSDADLKQKADSVAASMNRDQAEFKSRGVTDKLITAFIASSKDFGNMDSDEMWIGNVTTATQAKDALAESLKTKIRNIRNMAEVKWTTKSGNYRSYGFENMDALSDNKLVRLGRRVLKVATAQQADLAGQGLDAAALTGLTNNIDALDTAVDTKHDAEKDRDVAQQNRVEAGNALYTLMDTYCSIGKTIWANDAARFNDYVINPGGGATPPPTPPAK